MINIADKVIAGVALTLAISCSDPNDSGPSGDRNAPHVQISFPSSDSSQFDQDGDGLVDIVVSWSDDNAIDLLSAGIRSLDAGISTALSDWMVHERTSTGMRIEETLEDLHQAGVLRIEVSVADTAGNVGRDTITIDLPAAHYWKTISTNRGEVQSAETAFCGDGRSYTASGSDIVITNPATAELDGVVNDPYASGILQTPLCLDSLLYVTSLGEQMRLADRTWKSYPRPASIYSALAVSRSDPDLLYAGEAGTADVVVIQRSTNAPVRRFNLPTSRNEFQRAWSIVVLPNDEKLYVTRATIAVGGLVVVDPRSGAIVRQIDLFTVRAKLTADNRFVYGVSDDRVIEVDTRTDAITRTIESRSEGRGACLAVSPSGKRLFVTTVGGVNAASNFMIDVPTWRIVARFRLTPPGESRTEGCPAFRPDGKIFYSARNADIDVFLNRE